jgi:phage terminase large subunit
MHYDKTRRKLYIFYEIHKVSLSNRKAAELIKLENKNNAMITCDSAEPKSIDDMRSYNLRVKGAKKGPDSVEFGIKFLQDLEEIIIDPVRCPNTAREFINYELEKDAKGNFKAEFPDKDNHSIDCCRYATEDDQIERRQQMTSETYV